MRLGLTVVLFLFGQSVLAQKAVILSGGGLSDYERYSAFSQKAYQTYKANKITPQLITSDAKWKWTDPKTTKPATDKLEVLASIRKTLKETPPGGTFTLMVTDHGDFDSKKDKLDIYSTYIVLKSPDGKSEPQRISHAELSSLIAQNKPEGVKVKLMGIHCFSGGLNELAFYIPDTCSSSSTNQLKPTRSELDQNLYGFSFLDALKKKSSFADTHFSAMAGDKNNWGRGQLSSQAYVEKLFSGIDNFKYQRNQLEIDTVGLIDPSSTSAFWIEVDQNLKLNSKVTPTKNKCEAKDNSIYNIHRIGTYLNSLEENNKINEIFGFDLDKLTDSYQSKIKAYKDLHLEYYNKVQKIESDLKVRYKTAKTNVEKNDLMKKADQALLDLYKVEMYPKFNALIPYKDAAKIRHFTLLRKALLSPALNQKQKDKLISLIKCEKESFL